MAETRQAVQLTSQTSTAIALTSCRLPNHRRSNHPVDQPARCATKRCINQAEAMASGGGATTGKAGTGGDVDLFARTWESLDFGVVLERLSAECRTEMGRVRALVPDFKTTLEEVRRAPSCCSGWPAEVSTRVGASSPSLPLEVPHRVSACWVGRFRPCET